MNPIDKVLPLLDGYKRTGHNRGVFKCPAHDDKSPSGSIKETDNGTILLKCWAGCSFESIVAALGLEPQDLFPEKLDRFSETFYQKPKIPKFSHGELFDPLLKAAMLLMMGFNSAWENPLQSRVFFKKNLSDEDCISILKAMHIIESIYMESIQK